MSDHHEPRNYLYNPHEWKGFAFLCLLVALARISWTSLSAVGSYQEYRHLWDGVHSRQTIMDTLSSFCDVDMRILCGEPGINGKCIDIYGQRLGTILKVPHSSYQGRKGYVGRPSRPPIPGVVPFHARNCSITNGLFFQNPTINEMEEFYVKSAIAWVFTQLQLTSAESHWGTTNEIPAHIADEYARDLYCLFEVPADGKARASDNNSVLSQPWSHEQFLTAKQEGLKMMDPIVRDAAAAAFAKLGTEQPSDLSSICNQEDQHFIKEKANFQLFDGAANACMIDNYNKGRIMTEVCEKGIETVPRKLKEAEMEDSDFLVASHCFMFGVNFTSLLVLLMLFASKNRLEKRLDRGRDRLEQELNDPFLRESLEKKASALGEEDRINLIVRLQAKLAAWDSRGASVRLMLRYMRYYRLVTLFTIILTTAMYLVLHIFHVASLNKYLELVGVSFILLTSSYFVPFQDSKKFDHDPSLTQALISSEMSKSDGGIIILA